MVTSPGQGLIGRDPLEILFNSSQMVETLYGKLVTCSHMGAKDICFAQMRKPVCEDQVGELKVRSVQLFQG